jgi:hypothetical protein
VRSRLELTRRQILAFRRRVGGLEQRLPAGPASLERAAWAGLQDSMPRAALLSLHARVEGVGPSSWEHPALAQLWGPRYSTYVVAARDFALFSLGRLPDEPKARLRAEGMAERLRAHLDGARLPDRAVGAALGMDPNAFKYAAPTGTVAIRWDGARAPVVWMVAPPAVDPADARRELARRYLHVFGPTTPAAFTKWAGIGPAEARAAFDALAGSLTAVRTPIGDALILTRDEEAFRGPAGPAAAARLLPSGDAFYLLHGADRELLVPDPVRRPELWTPRVWPGALLVDGEVAGTWRRAETNVTIHPWRKLTRAERDAVEAEAVGLPLPGIDGGIAVRWEA